MGRYIKNGMAYMRGLWLQLLSKLYAKRSISSKVRVFLSASLDIEQKADLIIGYGAKIRERAVIAVRNGGKLEIGKNASVGMDCKIGVHDSVTIGEGTLLSPNVLIYDHDHIFDGEIGIHRKEFKTTPITIGNNCWIGADTVILRGTSIGDNCVIGAGSVIKGVYPPNSVIVQKREETVRAK